MCSVSSSGSALKTMTCEPGMSLACSHHSLGSAVEVSLSFCRLFLPTRMGMPVGESKRIGLEGSSFFICRRLWFLRT